MFHLYFDIILDSLIHIIITSVQYLLLCVFFLYTELMFFTYLPLFVTVRDYFISLFSETQLYEWLGSDWALISELRVDGGHYKPLTLVYSFQQEFALLDF